MKRKLCVLLSVLMVIALLVGCNKEALQQGAENTVETVTMSSLQEKINAERKAMLMEPLAVTSENFAQMGDVIPEDLSEEEVNTYTKFVHWEFLITEEAVMEDVDLLMRVLKSSYPGYEYFGGDEAFQKAYDNMTARIHETYKDGKASTDLFYRIMKDELSFVKDCNFDIGRRDMMFEKNHIFYDLEKTNYEKDSLGYFTVINDVRYYLAKEDEQDLRLTVSDDGDLVYGLFHQVPDDSNLPDKVCVTSEVGDSMELTTTWHEIRVGNKTSDRDHVHTYYEKEGITVSTLATMSLEEHDLKYTNMFINEAKELKEKDLFILDLRDNNGGANIIGDFFLYNLMDTKCDPNVQYVRRYTKLNKYHEIMTHNDIDRSDFTSLDFYLDNTSMVDDWEAKRELGESIPDGYTYVENCQPEFKEYDNVIIVLINDQTKSAAEVFLSKLATINNVIIMGSNSYGCMITDDVNLSSDIYLPNAGLAINYGQTMLYSDYMDDFDLNGWQPDIVTREDALDAAINMIKK